MKSQQLDEEAIFHIARMLDDRTARDQYLDQVCTGDQRLRERVLALLEVHQSEADFLKSAPEAMPTADFTPVIERPGHEIGRFRLREQIGEGGMGMVFVAEQERPIRRKVALKLIKPGMDSKAVLARFEAERQALAMMDHPNIAKVLDAGTTDSGRPYFAMELVKGVPITEYCDRNRLTIRQRLGLFIQVCHAIQHAHQKGIIHRDIKPSNVLVTLHDGQPIPKVIDFGVAKALNARLTDKTIYTEHLQVVGTLLYMSPEQAEISGLDVDTRSDIYSLGVLLYELLTGSTPFRQDELNKAGFDEQRRIIREQYPPRASVRISSLGETATTIAEHRRTDQRKLNQILRGELDWIVLKALEKDRTHRYQTGTELLQDVQRHLDDEPVEARPPSAAYRFRKFFRRNKTTVIGGFSAIVALIAGILGASAGMWWAMEERERAQSVLRTLSEELADRAIDAAFSGRRSEAQEAIEKARLANVPVDLLNTLQGLILFFDGDNEGSIRLLENAVASNPDSIPALSALAWVYHNLNDHSKRADVRKILRHLSTTPSTIPYEEFFLCLSRGGATHELQSTLTRLDALMSRRSRWGAAYAIRADIRMEYAMETREASDFRQAVDDFKQAQAILPDSVFVKAVGLNVLTAAIEFARAQNTPMSEWKTLADQVAVECAGLTDSSLAHSRAAVYFYSTGQEQRGRQIEAEFANHVPSISENTAIRILQGVPLSEVVRGLRSADAGPENQLCLALVLALRSESGRVEARRLLKDLTIQDMPSPLYVLTFDLAYLLGRPHHVVELIDAKGLKTSMGIEWRWWAYMTEYHSGSGKIDDDKLLEMAGPFSSAKSMANYAIALKAMGDRDLEKARKFFENTVATRRVGWWNYHWAQVFLRYLDDESWIAQDPVSHES